MDLGTAPTDENASTIECRIKKCNFIRDVSFGIMKIMKCISGKTRSVLLKNIFIEY